MKKRERYQKTFESNEGILASKGSALSVMMPEEEPNPSQDRDVVPVGQFFLIPMDLIDLQDQPRKDFPETEIRSLKDSILNNDLQQPITVTAYQDGKFTCRYKVLTGGRRYRAFQLLFEENADSDIGKKYSGRIPAIVKKLATDSAHSVIFMQLAENLQRQDLNPVEIAETLSQLRNDGFQWEMISSHVGFTRVWLSEILKILSLPASFLQKVRRNPKGFSTQKLIELSKEERVEEIIESEDLLKKYFEGKTRDKQRSYRVSSKQRKNALQSFHDRFLRWAKRTVIVKSADEKKVLLALRAEIDRMLNVKSLNKTT